MKGLAPGVGGHTKPTSVGKPGSPRRPDKVGIRGRAEVAPPLFRESHFELQLSKLAVTS
jgi:hypothetical protein